MLAYNYWYDLKEYAEVEGEPEDIIIELLCDQIEDIAGDYKVELIEKGYDY